MKKTRIIYWIFTGLLAVFIVMSSISSILYTPDSIAIIHTHLGYPLYTIRFLGVAKLLSAISIVYPGLPRLKEWAYAGFFFDLSGALFSLIAIGDPLTKFIPVFIIGYIILFGSYIFYHKKLKAI